MFYHCAGLYAPLIIPLLYLVHFEVMHTRWPFLLWPKPFSVDLCGCRNLNVVSSECGATSALIHYPFCPYSTRPASFSHAETDLNLWPSRRVLVNCLLKFHSEICL